MKKLNILVLEDDVIELTNLENNLNGIVGVMASVARDYQSAVKVFDENIFDLVLLDIELEGSDKTGIDFAHYVNAQNPVPIIFLTGTRDENLAKEAMKVNPSNFLLKPYLPAQVRRALELALYNFTKREPAVFTKRQKKVKSEESVFQINTDEVLVKDGNKFLRFNINDIFWIHADNLVTEIYTEDRKFIVSPYLKAIEAAIDSPIIRRIHRSHMINVSKFTSVSERQVIIKILGKEMEIPVSKTYRENLSEFFPPFL